MAIGGLRHGARAQPSMGAPGVPPEKMRSCAPNMTMYKNPDVWSPGWGSRRWLWPAELGGTGYVFMFYPGKPTSAGGFVRIGTFPKMVSQNDVNFLLNHGSGSPTAACCCSCLGNPGLCSRCRSSCRRCCCSCFSLRPAVLLRAGAGARLG